MTILSIPSARAIGWTQTSYAYREQCVSCPCCDTLITCPDITTVCHGCGWKPGVTVDRDRPSTHNGKPRLGVQGYEDKLDAEEAALIRKIAWDFDRIKPILVRAFDEHTAGNLPEARILLNEALDIEHNVTGDCKILGPLAEEWEVDYERDQRKPTP